MKVLIADDSEVMRKITSGYLKELGFTHIDHAADGAEALVKGKKEPYDVILLDWNMPKMQGIDVLTRLRASGNCGLIVMVTTVSDRRNVLEAIKVGANGYIMKPFQKNTFLDGVRQAFRHAGRPLP